VLNSDLFFGDRLRQATLLRLFPSPLPRTNEKRQVLNITVMFCTAAGDRPYKTPFSLVAVRTLDFVSSREYHAEPVASFYYELFTIIMIHVYQSICCVTLCVGQLP
jgi:hypothetical protein